MSEIGSSRSRGRQRAFTLLELLVVMAILVMMAALFPIALDRALPSRRIATTTQRLTALVHEAQMTSFLSGRPVALELGAHTLRVSLPDRVDRPDATDGRLHGFSFADSTQVRMLDAQGRPIRELLVYPDGSSGGARLQIEDNGHRGALAVGAITGRTVSSAPTSAPIGRFEP